MILMKSGLQWWEDGAGGGGGSGGACERGGGGNMIPTHTHLSDSRGELHRIDPYKSRSDRKWSHFRCLMPSLHKRYLFISLSVSVSVLERFLHIFSTHQNLFEADKSFVRKLSLCGFYQTMFEIKMCTPAISHKPLVICHKQFYISTSEANSSQPF